MENKIIVNNNADYMVFGMWRSLFRHTVNSQFLAHCVRSIALNDEAHNLAHVTDVCALSVKICDKLNVSDRDRLLVYMGVLLHDIGCRYERTHHHLIGYGLSYQLIENYCPGEFTPEEVLVIATSVLEHRSSNPTKPSSLVSSIVSVADSGAPDFGKYVKRAVQFRLKKKLEPDVIIKEVYAHLLEKFGVEGYHWKSYPDVGMEMFKEEWKDFSNKLYDEDYCMGLINDTYHTLGGGNEKCLD